MKLSLIHIFLLFHSGFPCGKKLVLMEAQVAELVALFPQKLGVVVAVSYTHLVAMTGEITLHGNVLPIGGLREKSMAAYREGMKTVLIPKDNVSDLYEVDDEVKKNKAG